MTDLEFISPNDGSVLALIVKRCNRGETDFEVAVKPPLVFGRRSGFNLYERLSRGEVL